MRFVLSIFLYFQLCLIAAQGAMLAGQPVRGGATVEIRFPVAKSFQDIAAQAGNPRPEAGRAVLTFPVGFDPARNWPILIVTSTSDFNRTSPMDAQWYRGPALAEGWVLLASDATIKPRLDSTQWRLAMLAAALESTRREWPQSAKWPVAFAGFSGGAKRSAVLGTMLAKTGSVKICGFFLSGINEDRLSEAYRNYRPGADFLGIPIWLSSGQSDNVAKPQDHDRVRASLERTGFRRVRLGRFSGGHQVKREEVERALRWFREVAKF
jgi:predicted esterase